MKEEVQLRKYHAPVWSEPVIMEMGHKGRRGIAIPEAEDEIEAAIGDATSYIPVEMRREDPPKLPELSQPEVLRHYLRLSQETIGMIGISLFGTCTMKYNPRVNEILAMSPQIAELHPYQDEDTVQGALEIIYKLDHLCREVSGMDQFVFQPGGGADAVYTHACVLRAYLEAKGELEQRNEIITTIFSHPCNGAGAASAGFKVITLWPGEHGYPELDALKAALSERTAGLIMVNPDDQGIYNPMVDEWTKAVHDVGGICFHDQANFNGTMAILRSRDAGFDACMYMLHKTFGAPKAGMGNANGAYGCTKELAPFLPAPIVTFDGEKYHLDYDRPQSMGKVKEFYGNINVVLKAYGWMMSMGPEALLEACHLSVIGSNYLEKLLMAIPGVSRPAYTDKKMLEMIRYSWEKLQKDTGVGTQDVRNRMTDFGLDAYFMSHEPWIVPEPFTPETGECYSKEDIDYWAAVLKQISKEAYSNPEIVKTAPHNQVVHQVDTEAVNDPQKWAMTWRAYLRKRGKV